MRAACRGRLGCSRGIQQHRLSSSKGICGSSGSCSRYIKTWGTAARLDVRLSLRWQERSASGNCLLRSTTPVANLDGHFMQCIPYFPQSSVTHLTGSVYLHSPAHQTVTGMDLSFYIGDLCQISLKVFSGSERGPCPLSLGKAEATPHHLRTRPRARPIRPSAWYSCTSIHRGHEQFRSDDRDRTTRLILPHYCRLIFATNAVPPLVEHGLRYSSPHLPVRLLQFV